MSYSLYWKIIFLLSNFNFTNLPTLICIGTHTTRVPVTSRSKWYVHGTLGLGNFHFYSNCLVGNKRRLIHARRRHVTAATTLPPSHCHRRSVTVCAAARQPPPPMPPPRWQACSAARLKAEINDSSFKGNPFSAQATSQATAAGSTQ